ncbi:hypothetical protein WR25_13793 [Diploscapter pachys]|uniref:Phospholipase A2 domain-containing protein n=1 Tax=Diploscapter pachys TaxID=2018661 RepID=A0A2A2JIB3_9BILA|nr:hypothetical protein WR25_13793 [Diploscapter pachys]
MKLFSPILLLALFSIITKTNAISGWDCGNGTFSTYSSFFISYFSYRNEINDCCYQHDEDIKYDYLSRHQADDRFCQCLDRIDSFYARWVVKPSFCNAVKAYSYFTYSPERSRISIDYPTKKGRVWRYNRDLGQMVLQSE